MQASAGIRGTTRGITTYGMTRGIIHGTVVGTIRGTAVRAGITPPGILLTETDLRETFIREEETTTLSVRIDRVRQYAQTPPSVQAQATIPSEYARALLFVREFPEHGPIPEHVRATTRP